MRKNRLLEDIKQEGKKKWQAASKTHEEHIRALEQATSMKTAEGA